MARHGRMKVLQDKELLTELRDDILVIALEMVSGGYMTSESSNIEGLQY